jgi:hypothetical protein
MNIFRSDSLENLANEDRKAIEDFAYSYEYAQLSERLHIETLARNIKAIDHNTKNIYFFAQPQGGEEIHLPLAEKVRNYQGNIPVRISNMDLSGTMVKTDWRNVPVLTMLDKYEKKFTRAVENQAIDLKKLTGTITECINASTMYDFDETRAHFERIGLGVLHDLASTNYKPKKSEINLMRAGEVGMEIRKVLKNLRFEDNIQYIVVPFEKDKLVHDTTAVIDTSTLKWNILCSKHPFHMNLTIPDQVELKDLGRPTYKRL